MLRDSDFSDFDFGNMDLQQDLLEGLNPEQKEAVLHNEGPLLILAGAGSGKTRVITHRIAYLVQNRGVSPRSILAITFTNKAAAEMKTRVESLVGDNTSRGMWIGTFHSMMARVLRRFANVIGFTNNFAIADTADQQSLIKECVKDLNLNDKTFTPRDVLGTISNAKNALLGPAEYKKHTNGEFWQDTVAKIYTLYQERLQANNLMDFDDLLYYPVILFRQNPDILRLYQERFRYIMVDEYQDTNGAQYEIVKLLSARHKNLAVVGDDDQSIYSFRGANVQNILDFEKDFKNCKVIKLEQNYRSTGNILDSANYVINNNSSRKDKALWTSKGEGDKVVRFFAQNERSEAIYIAEEINRLVRTGENTFNDIAILYRINALSRNLEFMLNQAGIDFKIYGGLRFFDRREIKDTMSYLRLLTSPRDNTAFTRAIQSPRRGVGDTTLARMQEIGEAEGISLMEVSLKVDQYSELSRASARIKDFVRLIATMQRTLLNEDWTLAQYIEYVQNESGLMQELVDNKDKNREDSFTRIENMKELLSEAVNFQNTPNDLFAWEFTDEELSVLEEAPEEDELNVLAREGSEEGEEELTESLLEMLTRFLEQSTLYSDLDQDTGEEVESVKLMTIHSAKGLEYKTVFVVGMEEGIFPGYRSMGDASSLEEERRLAYVAITRAEEKLFLSASDSRLIFGRTEQYMPSRFLAELPEENVRDLGQSNNIRRRAYSDAPSTQVNPGFTPTKTSTGAIPKPAGLKNSAAPSLKPKIQKAGNLSASDIKKGQTVRHGKHGVGKVIAIEPVAGDAILLIDFKTAGEKKMLANSANLAAE